VKPVPVGKLKPASASVTTAGWLAKSAAFEER